MYNKYGTTGSYGTIGESIAPESLRLTDLKWETTTSWNIGANLNLFNDLTVCDNIFMGKEYVKRGGMLDKRKMMKEA